jgi:hypothetical protein
MSMQLRQMDEADGDGQADATAEERRSEAPDRLDRSLRDCGRAVATRELRTAMGRLDGLTPAQRRTVAHMAGRIAAGVLEPARDVSEEERPAVARLFDPERIRDGG